MGYSLCRQKSFRSPYTATFGAICCSCFTLRLQTGGYSIDAHAIISEFNEGIRELLGESTNGGEAWIQLRSLVGAQWDHLVLRNAKSVEDELGGLENLSLGEPVAYTKHHSGSAMAGSRGEETLGDAAIQVVDEGKYGVINFGRGDGTRSAGGVGGSDKTVEEISRSLGSMCV